MYFRNAHQILYTLLQSRIRTASDKIAIRWLFAGLMNPNDYDIFFRLQILEGALGAREGQWWSKGRRGLVEAEKASEGANIQPEWFNPKNSGMFSIVYRRTDALVKAYKMKVDTDDILQDVLLGEKRGKHAPAYILGTKVSDKILNGKSTPQEVGAGWMSKYIKRWIQNDIRGEADETPIQNEDYTDLTPRKKNIEDSYEKLIELIYDSNSKIGKYLRDFGQKIWKGTGQEQTMELWRNLVESNKPFKLKSLAEKMNVTPTALKYHWNMAWEKFFDNLSKNPKLVYSLELYFTSLGMDFEPPDPKTINLKHRPLPR